MALDRKDYKTAIPQLEKQIKSVEQKSDNGLAQFDILQQALEAERLARQRAILKVDESVDLVTVKMYYVVKPTGVIPTADDANWSETMPTLDSTNDDKVLWYKSKTFRNGVVVNETAPQQIQLMNGVFSFINTVSGDNGWTTIDGDTISTGRIQDNLTGDNYFDLDDGTFNFGDSNGNYIRQLGNGVEIQGTLSLSSTVGTGTLNDIVEDMADFAQDVIDINGDIQGLQSQIDGNITTWFYAYVPTNSNSPASNWISTGTENVHLGDLFYDTTTGYAYRWQSDGATPPNYSWLRITDSDVTKALADAAAAQDTADHKRRVFVTTPTPPYDVGDLWAGGSTGDLKKCKTAKAEGQSYSATDWELASKYTDDSALNTFINGTFATTVSNLQTGIADAKVETWKQDNDPSSSWNAGDKPKHEGDMWYCTKSSDTTHYGKYWIYTGSAWEEMVATPPDAVFDEIDGKATIFTGNTTPSNPSEGDLWFKSANDPILTYVNGSWGEYNKYTDDAVANTKVKDSQRIYYRKSTVGTPSAPNSWVTTNTNVYEQWTTKVPPLASNKNEGTTKYPYLYSCLQTRTSSSSTPTCSAVLLDENTLVLDGGNIIANSITTNQINTNTITVGSLNDGSNYSTTSQMNGAISDALDSYIQIGTASGNIASFTASDYPAINVVANIDPIQDLNGYDKPWVGGAGKNKLPTRADGWTSTSNGVTITFNSDGSVTLNGTATATTIWNLISNTTSDNRLYLPQGDYILNGDSVANTNFWIGAYQNADSGAWAISSKANGGAFSLGEGKYIFPRIRIGSGVVLNNVTIYPMIRLASVSDATFAPYENICPISGHTEVDVVVSPTTDAEDGNTYTTPLGQTVYGGTLDVVSGELTVDRAYVDLGTLNWTRSTTATSGVYRFYSNGISNAVVHSASASTVADILSSQYVAGSSNTTWNTQTSIAIHTNGDIYVYDENHKTDDAAAFKTAMNGVQLVYPLATPQTYQLTPQQVQLLQGTNNVWADTGDINIKYAIIADSVVEALASPIDGASKVATSYITQIDDGGIKVHDAGDAANYSKIDSTGMQVYKDNENVASFGETITLGKTDSGRLEIDNNGITITNPDSSVAMSMETSEDPQTITYNKTYTESTGAVAHNTSRPFTLALLNDAPADTAITISVYGFDVYSDEDVVAPITVYKGTPSSGTFNGGVSLRDYNGTYYASYSYDGTTGITISETANFSGAGLYLKSVKFETTGYATLAKIGGTLTLSNHSTPIGTRLSDNGSQSMSSSTSMADMNLNVTLPAGAWIINASVRFAENNTGRRACQIYIDGSPVGPSYCAAQAGQSGETALTTSVSVSKETAMILSLGARQNSGASLTVTFYFDAMRIA